jgi:hypothetical protein
VKRRKVAVESEFGLKRSVALKAGLLLDKDLSPSRRIKNSMLLFH